MFCEVPSPCHDLSHSRVVSRIAVTSSSSVKHTGSLLRYCQQAPERDHYTFLSLQVPVRFEPFRFLIREMFRYCSSRCSGRTRASFESNLQGPVTEGA
jgi:hypothetical protein